MDIRRMVTAVLLSLTLAFFSVKSFAIQINVSSPSNIYALGFIVDGKKYGGLGTSYNNDEAPVGTYTFGVRNGGDITCYTRSGQREVFLKKNTNAVLKYDGRKCIMQLSSD